MPRCPSAATSTTALHSSLGPHELAERAYNLLKRNSALDALSPHFTPDAASETLLLTRTRPALTLRFLQWAQSFQFFSSSLRSQCLALHLLSRAHMFPPALELARGLIASHEKPTACSARQFSVLHCLLSTLLPSGDGKTKKVGKTPVFDLLIKSYCSLGMVNEARGALDLIKSAGFAPGTLSYNSIFEAMFRSRTSIDDVLKAFEDMTHTKVSPNVYSYNILIKGFVSRGDLARGLTFFEDMEKAGCSPNVVTFNTVIDAYCKSGRTSEALKVLRRVQQRNLRPNLVSYNSVINGLCLEGLVKETGKIIDEMNNLGLTPDRITYNTLVNGYCKAGDFHHALVLHEEMVQKGLTPNVITYTSLISTMCKTGNLDRAMQFVRQMRERGLQLNEVTYTALVDGFSRKGYLEDAHLIMKEMADDEIPPSVAVYNALINGYCLLGRLNEARGIIQELENRGLVPDVVTYSTLLSGYCKNREVDKALELSNMMIGKVIMPDAVTYSSLMKGLCEERRLEEAHALFEKMLTLGCFPDEFTYTTLIDGYCKEGDTGRALLLHDEMLKRKMFPDVVTYSVLINGLKKKARTQEAKRLLFKLFYEENVPDNVVYDVLISCCVKAEYGNVVALLKSLCMKGLINEANNIFESVLEKSKPDEAAFDVMIHGNCRGGNVRRALALYKEMLQAGWFPNAITAVSLIKALSDNEMNEEVNDIIQRILSNSAITDAETSKTFIDINNKEGNMEAVFNALKLFARDGLVPNSRVKQQRVAPSDQLYEYKSSCLFGYL